MPWTSRGVEGGDDWAVTVFRQIAEWWSRRRAGMGARAEQWRTGRRVMGSVRLGPRCARGELGPPAWEGDAARVRFIQAAAGFRSDSLVQGAACVRAVCWGSAGAWVRTCVLAIGGPSGPTETLGTRA